MYCNCLACLDHEFILFIMSKIFVFDEISCELSKSFILYQSDYFALVLHKTRNRYQYSPLLLVWHSKSSSMLSKCYHKIHNSTWPWCFMQTKWCLAWIRTVWKVNFFTGDYADKYCYRNKQATRGVVVCCWIPIQGELFAPTLESSSVYCYEQLTIGQSVHTQKYFVHLSNIS